MNFFKTHPKLWKRSLAVLVVLVVAGGIWALYSPWFRLKLAHGWGCTQIAEITFEEGPVTFLVSQSGEELYVDFLQTDERGMPYLLSGFSSEGWTFGHGAYIPPPKNEKSGPIISLDVLVRWVDAPGTERTFPVEEPVDIQVRYYSVGNRTLEAVLFRTEEADYSGSQWQMDKAYELLGEAS